MLGIEGDDLAGMTDDAPLRREDHPGLIGEASMDGLSERREMFAARKRMDGGASPRGKQNEKTCHQPHDAHAGLLDDSETEPLAPTS